MKFGKRPGNLDIIAQKKNLKKYKRENKNLEGRSVSHEKEKRMEHQNTIGTSDTNQK